MSVLSGVYSLGNATVLQGGSFVFNLNVIPTGATVKSIPVTLSGTVIASATYTFVNSGQNQGQLATFDDVDALAIAILPTMDTRISSAFQNTSALGQLFMRSAFAYMNRQDYQCSLANGTSITSTSGNAFTLTINFPVELRELATDLAVMQSGSYRFAGGASQIRFNYGAGSSTNFTGTFANGSTTFTIAAAGVKVAVQSNQVDVGYGGGLVGSLWELTQYAGAQTTSHTQNGIHLGFFDCGPGLTSNSYTPTVYNAWNGAVPIAQNSSPSGLTLTYRSQQTVYGVDPTLRIIPILSYGPRTTLGQINQSGQPLSYQVTAGVNTLTLMELIAHPPTATELASVAVMVGGGSPVAVAVGTPPSGASGPAASALLPCAIANTAEAPPSWARMAPSQVGSWYANATASAQGAAGVAQTAGKVGQAVVRGR